MDEYRIEENLLQQLKGNDQWDRCDEITTIDKLWDNLRNILNRNNVAKLDGIPLSDNEFAQIRNELTFSSNFDAAKFLVGQNGICHVSFKRDNTTVSLDLFYRNSRFGNNTYQVVHQIMIPKNIGMDKDRRFDVTLLINGLPLIQIELKQTSESEISAYEQIKKYENEGCYRGIFRFIQMFVVSNSSVTKYFAAGDYDEISKTHLNLWRNNKNITITNLNDFINLVLKRPMAYDIITRYTVLEEDKNNGRKRIILLRPYQIHAIEAIEEASKKSLSGYIWHTTGSGKTLTSYKATRNLVNDIPSINKSIFLVDRKDLDNQTANSFLAYSENDVIDIEKTSSTGDLKRKLYKNDEQVIVTTIQKLSLLIKELEYKKDDFYKIIKNKRIAFVVDECHRTITPDKMMEVRKFFHNSLWYGFTGTPRFEENSYDNNGYARTTDELYGKLNGNELSDCCLHKYTIENAIKDKAVLGFNVNYLGSDDEKKETKESWLSETHMLNVIKKIVGTFNIHGLSNSAGNTFESILTVSNIKIAQKYYELFKKVVNGDYEKAGICIDKRILQVLPDFPKFAISYSVADDNDSAEKFEYNSNKMKESIEDYNQIFGTSFSMENIDTYNSDLQNRLQRIGKKYANRSEQVDIVIVVNRLLTGFDAVPLANLFIDRQPSELHTTIQMFSRTNRISPKLNKEFGTIITFQSPKLRKENVKKAVSLFTNGGENYAIARSFEDVKKDYLKKYDNLLKFKMKYENLDEIENISDDKQKEFMHYMQNYNDVLKEIRTYVDYVNVSSNEDDIQNNFDENGELKSYGNITIPEIDEDTFDEMKGHYNSLVKKFSQKYDSKLIEGLDLEYKLDVYDIDKINLEYIASLMDSYKNGPNAKLENDIINYILKVKSYNSKLGDILEDYFQLLKKTPDMYMGRTSFNVIEEMKSTVIKEKCKEIAEKYNLNGDILYFSACKYTEILENADEIDDINEIVSNAKVEGKLPYLAISYVKPLIKKAFDEEILPLNRTI